MRPGDSEDITIRPMVRHELDLTLGWAMEESWNPGLHDAEAFWAADPRGFVVAERQGEIVGTGAIVAYGSEMGFMGLFMVRKHLRGKGIGRRLWLKRRDLLLTRLRPDGVIGMDGVMQMLPFYQSGGFEFSHTQTRYKAVPATPAAPLESMVSLAALPFADVSDYDHAHFGVRREDFLRHWIAPRAGAAKGLLNSAGSLVAMGVIRRGSQEGYKIGPLFADTPEAAELLFQELVREAGGEVVCLDVPTNNPHAMELASRHNMIEVFSCGRMYLGTPPSLRWDQIYGNTTFELG